MSQDRISLSNFERFAHEKVMQKPAPRCRLDKVNVCGPIFSIDQQDPCIDCACEWLKVQKEAGTL